MSAVVDLFRNGAALVMKYECKQIERRMRLVCAEIARFINEYAEFKEYHKWNIDFFDAGLLNDTFRQ